MNLGNSESQKKFWKTYFITLACFFLIGSLPSLYLIKKHGLFNLLTKDEILSLLGIDKITSLFGVETKIFEGVETKTADAEAQAEIMRIAKGLPWLICKGSSFESETNIHISVEGEMTIRLTCSGKDAVSYYKEKLKENGFSYQVVDADFSVLIKAKNDEVRCNIEISDDDVTIVLSKLKS